MFYQEVMVELLLLHHTAQKMKFSTEDFFRKCDQIRRKLRIWLHLLKNFLMEKKMKKRKACYRAPSLYEKCPYSEFFWSVFSRIRTEYRPEKLRKRSFFTQSVLIHIGTLRDQVGIF